MRKFLFFIVFCTFVLAQNSYDGIVYSKQNLKLSMQLDGIIVKIYHNDGEKIKKGEAILKLDDTLQMLEVDRKKIIYEDDSEYISTQENLKITQNVLKSTKELYEKDNAVSKDELSNIQMQYLNLNGKLNSLQAKQKGAKVEYEIAKEILKKYTLYSPINGVIKDITYDIGEWIKTGDVIVTVVDIDNSYVELNIDEPIAREIKLNTKATITSNNDTIKKEGFVSYIAPSAEDSSSFVKVRVSFKNTTPKITTGVVAKVTLNKGI